MPEIDRNLKFGPNAEDKWNTILSQQSHTLEQLGEETDDEKIAYLLIVLATGFVDSHIQRESPQYSHLQSDSDEYYQVIDDVSQLFSSGRLTIPAGLLAYVSRSLTIGGSMSSLLGNDLD